mmetsp:Transcript_11737/g.42875  ORF Transcript_11737/g.42875 Transcript_11737/m.42875 type:complete len:247 (-) Transcript_11737:376-1116(-)
MSTTVLSSSTGRVRDIALAYLPNYRPWFGLYGHYLRPPTSSSAGTGTEEKVPLIHELLTEELLQEIFLRLDVVTRGRAACVCRYWRGISWHHMLWKNACERAWMDVPSSVLSFQVHQDFRGSWRNMWMDVPRLRRDGLYISRNTYIRAGVTEWQYKNPVHLVCYFRYYRFLSGQRFLYRISPEIPAKIAPLLRTGKQNPKQGVYLGHYTLDNDKLDCVVRYQGMSLREAIGACMLHTSLNGSGMPA